MLSSLDSHVFLQSVVGPSFMIGLRFSIYLSVALVLVGAIFSYIRGKKYVIEEYLSNDDDSKKNKADSKH